eukprot:4556280-Pyramimonas_sp.AAC.1
MEDTCAVCLEEFMPRENIYLLRCNHLFHEECWNSNVVRHVANQREGDPQQPVCAICRAPGIIASSFPWTGSVTQAPEQAARELRE